MCRHFYINLVVSSAIAFCLVGSSELHHSLSLATNELDTEILNLYSDGLNNLTDLVLETVRNYLIETHKTKVGIPKVEFGFNETFFGVSLYGEFKAYNGLFYNAATIQREGDTKEQLNPFKTNLSIIVGFSDMEVYFPNYTVNFIGIEEDGDVHMTVRRNRIFLELMISFIPQCTVAVTSVKLTEFSDITMDITGLSILNGLIGDITAWILSSYETTFSLLIENIVSNKIQEVLKELGGFCKFRKTVTDTRTSPRNVLCRRFKDTTYKCGEI